MDISWGCGYFVATLFVLVNLIGQLGGVFMVLFRKKVEVACGILLFIVVLQVMFGPLYISYLVSLAELSDNQSVTVFLEIWISVVCYMYCILLRMIFSFAIFISNYRACITHF